MKEKQSSEAILERNAMMNNLLTVPEVAKILKVNRNTVYKLIRANELKAVLIGSLKVTEEDLQAFISSRTLLSDTVERGNL